MKMTSNKKQNIKYMKKIITIGLLLMGGLVSAQTGGTIKGIIFDSDSTAVPFASVKMEVAGNIIGVLTDINGKYKFNGVNAGVYNLNAKSNLHGERKISGVTVNSDQITKVNLYLTDGIMGDIIEIVYTPPKININQGMTINKLDLKHSMDLRDPKAMLVKKSSEIKLSSDNKLIIRGSRPGDVIYYVDGVKQSSMQGLPGVAIGGMQVFTGGIPAKYGDTTGGVVILETKSYFDLYYAWKANQ